MAIIYTYPVKGTPLAADLLLISDTADGNKSKNATIASLVTSNAIDVVDTLNSLKGDINITGGTNITVTPSGQNIEISTSASNVDGSGTASKIPMWSDSNTLTDSTATSGLTTIVGGAVELYYAGNPADIDTKKFETTVDGTKTIGIHTINPRYPGTSGTQTGLILKDPGAGENEGLNIQFLSGSDTNSAFIGSLSNDQLRIGTANIERIRVNASGNVGIGPNSITAPSQRLDVDGNIITSGQIFIPGDIVHTSDVDSVFGFPNNDHFRVSVNSGSDQFSVVENQTLMKTDSTIKFLVSDTAVNLYNIRESGGPDPVTNLTDLKLQTDIDGIKIKGKSTTMTGVLNDAGGTIKFYSSGNNKYVGIQGPLANDGSDYVLRMPKSVGTAGQVLKLNNPLISPGSNQDLVWSDAGGGGGHKILDIASAGGTVTHNSTTFKQISTPGGEIDVNTIQCFLIAQTASTTSTNFGLYEGELTAGNAVLLAYGSLAPSPFIPASTRGYNDVPLLDGATGQPTTITLSAGTNYIIGWSTNTAGNLVGSNSQLVGSGPVNVLSNSSPQFTGGGVMRGMTGAKIANDYTLAGVDCPAIVLYKV